jgi:hypothetical protein
VTNAGHGPATHGEIHVEQATMPPPGPPRLFVVPQPELTPLPPPSPFSTPRPAGPQPLFVVPPTPAPPSLRPPKSPLVWYTTAAAAIGLVALGAALLVSHPAPRNALPAPPVLQAPPAPQPIATPIAAPIAAPIAKAPTDNAAALDKLLAAPKTPAVVAKPVVHAPPRHHVARPRPAPAAETPSSEPERTVKEGRIVDPFAGLK